MRIKSNFPLCLLLFFYLVLLSYESHTQARFKKPGYSRKKQRSERSSLGGNRMFFQPGVALKGSKEYGIGLVGFIHGVGIEGEGNYFLTNHFILSSHIQYRVGGYRGLVREWMIPLHLGGKYVLWEWGRVLDFGLGLGFNVVARKVDKLQTHENIRPFISGPSTYGDINIKLARTISLGIKADYLFLRDPFVLSNENKVNRQILNLHLLLRNKF